MKMRCKLLFFLMILYSLHILAEDNELYTIEGPIEVLQADDFVEQRSQTFVLLRTTMKRNQVVERIHSLHWESDIEGDETALAQAQRLTTGTVVRAVVSPLFNYSGVVLSDTHQLAEDWHNPDGNVAKKTRSLPGEEELSTNDDTTQKLFTDQVLRRLAVIITDFEDVKVSCTSDYIYNLIWGPTSSDFSTVKGSFDINSWGRYSFTPNSPAQVDVFGPFKIPIYFEAESTCRSEEWAWHAMAAANASGVNLLNYRHVMFVLPASEHIQRRICKWNGLGNMGCGFMCKTWITNCDQLGVYVHELGHNVGFRHANVNWDFKGPVVEYGDPTAIMGNKWFSNTNVFYFNAAHRIQAGWIPQHKTLQVAQSGLWRFTSFNRPVDGMPQAVVIPAPHLKNVRPQPVLVLSFMTDITSEYADKCLIHVFYSNSRPTEFIYTLVNPGDVWRDPSLTLAIILREKSPDSMTIETFYECVPGPSFISITTKDTMMTSLTVNQTFIGSALLRDFAHFTHDGLINDPFSNTVTNQTSDITVLFRKPTSRSSVLHHFNFTVAVRNSDSPLCTPVTYTFSAVDLPNGWLLECSPEKELLLVGQQECYIECSVTLPEELTNDVYSITLDFQANSTFPFAGRSKQHKIFVVGQHICYPSSPVVTLSTKRDANTPPSSLVLDAAIGEYLYLTLDLYSSDSNACAQRNMNVTIHTPTDWVVENGGSVTLQLSPTSHLQRTFMILVPDSAVPSSPYNSTLTVVDVNSLIHYNWSLTIIPTSRCSYTMPSVAFSTDLDAGPLIMDARTGAWLQINITNADSSPDCAPAIYRLTVRTNDYRLQVTPLPDVTRRAYNPGEVAEVALTFTASDLVSTRDEDKTVKVDIRIQDTLNAYRPYYDKSFNITVLAQACTRYLPQALWGSECNSAVDISTHNLEFRCQLIYWNRDTWPCPESGFRPEFIPLGEEQAILEYNFDFEYTMIGPQNATTNYLHLKLNATYLEDLVNETHAMSVPFFVRLWTNDYNLVNYTTKSITVGKCHRKDPAVVIEEGYEVVHAFSGEFVYFRIAVQTMNNYFCGTTVYTVGLPPFLRSELQQLGFRGMDNKSILNQGVATISIQPPTHFAGILNLTFIVTDNANSTFMANATAVLNVTSECIVNPLKVEVIEEASPPEFYGGAPTTIRAKFNVTNMDFANCSSVVFGATASTTNSMSTTVTPKTFELAPKQWQVVEVSTVSVPNVAPGDITISLTAGSEQAAHTASASTKARVLCQPPRPVSELRLEQQASMLGISTAIKVSWRACDRPGDCCCPCQYEIYRDGTKIATTTYTNYTYTSTLAQAGESLEFTVHVVDKNGVRSTENTCGYSGSIVLSSSDLDYVAVLFVVLGVAFLPTLIIVLEKLRTKKILL